MGVSNATALALLAEVGALRAILARFAALQLAQSEADPAAAAALLKGLMCRTPTRPPDGHGLDPATSDMLAAMTDERIEALMDEIAAAFGPVPGRGRPLRDGLPA